MFARVTSLAFQSGNGGWIGSWSPGIGDPNVVGWLTVVAYLAASFCCWRQYRRLREPPGAEAPNKATTSARSLGAVVLAFFGARKRLLDLPLRQRLRTLWLGLTLVLLLLGINKQLDLQTVLTEVGRIVSKAEGWYEIRRRVQLAFIFFVAIVGLATFRAVLLLARGELRNLRAVLAGTLFIICFVTIRAASFHHIDLFLGSDIGGFKMNWVIELGGILFIIWGAVRTESSFSGSSTASRPPSSR
jgi:hypothetical protein